MQKIKVMTVFGTRPEAIKMAPIVKALQEDERFEAITTVTGQHREMLDQVLKIFAIQPDYDLDIMHHQQTLTDITANVLIKLQTVLQEAKPDIVLVHGDTTTTFAASVAAFYQQIPLGHVEAGLRTWDKYAPYPEEMNRQMTDVLTDLYFAPTSLSQENLLKEGHYRDNIYVTGNTAIDALKQTVSADYQHQILTNLDPQKKLVLVTMHRRENQGIPMERVLTALRQEVEVHPEIEVVYPVHLSPVVQEVAHRVLGNHPRIHLIEPLDVLDFHNLAAHAYLIMTDSGGVQEEAPSLGKPVLVLRDTTERPEGVAAGTLKVVGTQPDKVKTALEELLNDEVAYQKMAQAKNPYGDGQASTRILQAIAHYFNRREPAPNAFEI